MLNRVVLLSCLVLAGCSRQMEPSNRPPPSAYIRLSDQLAERMISWGLPWREPCSEKKVVGNVASVETRPALQCYKMGPLRRWKGLWRNDVNGPYFCPQPATHCAWAPDWIEFEVGLPSKFKGMDRGGLYDRFRGSPHRARG